MGKFNTILFDFDGTVMDTNDVIIGSWQHTFRTVEGKERPVEGIIQTFGEPLVVTMEKLLPQVPVEEAVAIYRSFHHDNFGDLISLFPGMKELIAEIKAKGYKTGLVTSRMKNTTLQGMDKYQLAPYFDTVVTCEDTDKHKPDPEPVLIALKNLNAKPEESIMLGDSMFDILCARNAGVKAVLVSWSLVVGDEERNGPDGPDYYIENPMDLLSIIG